MKRKLIAFLALAGILAAGNVMAAGTATVDVTATIMGTCAFDTANYTMDFGSIDPALPAGDKTATVQLAFTCSNGTVYTLDDVSGAHAAGMTGAFTAATMDYSIDAYTLSNTGTGATQTVDVTGRITQAVYSVATADVYTDQLTINITP